MGLLSGIKKIGKGIVKGIKKVFKGVGKFVGKIVGSKWGKTLMAAATVFTGGMALAAGVGAFTGQAASATFLTKFVAGAKGFVGALLNPVGAAKGFFGNLGQGLGAAAQGAAQGVGALPAGADLAQAAAEQTAEGAATMANAPSTDPTTIVAEGGAAAPAGGGGVAGAPGASPTAPAGVDWSGAAPGGAPGAAAPGAQQGGFLSRAASGTMDFLKSPGGGKLAAGLVQGYAEGAAAEEKLRQEEKMARYYDEAWRDPRQLELLHRVSGRGIRTPQGFLDRARRFSRETDRHPRTVTYAPTGA